MGQETMKRLRRDKVRRKRKAGVWVFAAAVFLMGCSAIELEDRMFPQAMELDLREGELTGGFGEFLVSGNNVKEICRNYQEYLDKYLDLGHIRTIVLGEELTAEREQLRKVLLELEELPQISRNTLVFIYPYQGEESLLGKFLQEGKEPGKYLADWYRNHPYKKSSSAVTLAELLDEAM